MPSLLNDLTHEQSARIGEMIITVHEAARDAQAEEVRLLRAELSAAKSAWRVLWEKAGCPAGVPEQQ